MKRPGRFSQTVIFSLLILAIAPSAIYGAAKAPVVPARDVFAQSGSELAAAVNALRVSRGQGALNVHPILMNNAQNHANYMAATGSITHISGDGLRPFQRALAAGYSVAGDLSLGGFFSENILAGGELNVQGAIDAWLSDEPHTNTMLSPNRSDIGAGIAYAGGLYYYVVDTGLQSSRPVQYTPPSGEVISQDPVALSPGATSTPNPDGSVAHTVRSGETLWTIANAYAISLEQITLLNRINRDRFIHPGDQLIIRLPQTATFTPRPTSTPRTRRPTATPLPVETQTQSAQPPLNNTLVTGLYIFAVVVFLVFIGLELRKRTP